MTRLKQLLTSRGRASLGATIAVIALASGVAAARPATVAAASGATHYVATSGDDVGDCSQASPCRTIQGAVNKSGDGGTIVVAPGTYNETVNITASLTIMGQGGAAATIIDTGGAGTGVIIPQLLVGSYTVSLTGLTIRNGRSADVGGGIVNYGVTTLTNSIVDNNTAAGRGGGIYNQGALTIVNSTIEHNTAREGGGIATRLTAYAVTLIGSTVANNTAATNGGGIYVGDLGMVALTNSTVADNIATSGAGGGIVGYAPSPDKNAPTPGQTTRMTLAASTMAGNSATVAGGIVGYNFSPTIENTILAGNNATMAASDCAQQVTSYGHNLIGVSDCAGLVTGVNGDAVGKRDDPIDPRLGPLRDNGGPTPTLALLPTSPAINVVPLANCMHPGGESISTDQRGDPRPSPGRACDIGAYQYQGSLPATSTPTNTPVPPTSTSTPVPPTATSTSTSTPVAPRPTAVPVATVAPLLTRAYFAGGVNTRAEHPTIGLLNPSRQRARVRLTFYHGAGAPSLRDLTLAPSSVQRVPVAALRVPAGDFGLAVASDQAVSARLTSDHPGRDGASLLGVPGLSKSWYLVADDTHRYTGEVVSILNPDARQRAHVRVRLLAADGGRARVVDVVVPPHSDSHPDVNGVRQGRALDIVASSDLPVLVERTLASGVQGRGQGRGLTTQTGSPRVATHWLFAEGATARPFQTFLTILNPNAVAARVTARLYGRAGRLLKLDVVTVGRLRHATLKLDDRLKESGIASVVTSNVGIVAARTMYAGSPSSPATATSDVSGSPDARFQWNFPPDGAAGERQYLLLYNPSNRAMSIDVTLYGGAGRTAPRRVRVGATARYVIDVRGFARGLSVAAPYGAVLRAPDGRGFVAEQTIFAPNGSTLQSLPGAN